MRIATELVGETGNCAGQWEKFSEDTEYMFASGNLRKPPLDVRYPYAEEAKAMCSTCPLMDLCREIGAVQTTGIWGGIIVNP